MILIVVEGLALFVAVAGSIFAWGRPVVLDERGVVTVLGQAAAISLCCIVAFYYNDLYDLRIVRSFSEFGSRLLQSFGVALILLAGFYTLFPETRIADGRFPSSLLMIVGVLLPLRAIGYTIMRWRAFADRVLILGTGIMARTLVQEIDARPHYRYAIVAVVDDGHGHEGSRLPYPLLGPLEHLDKIIEEIAPDRIIVALTERRGRMPMRQLLDAEAHGILVEDGLSTYETFTGKLAIEALTPSFLIFSGAFRKSRMLLATRRLISLGVAAVGLVLTAPLMALTALAIKLDSSGPLFFIDERASRGGHPFRLVKFRTMYEQASELEGHSVWSRDDSNRITRVGRWIRKLRVDELPQFWNILKGDMDLVGPRPEILRNVKTMSEQIPYYSLRHVVRPGLTGWAQIRHGYSVSLEQVTEKIRHDLFYIKHMSLWLDLRILADTVKIVLFGRGAQ
jgi:exopolysaccharide biosynthesis polyprenyl glycosylphosphotransferase